MNEEQKVQELLKPRVIVENKWPGCDFEVGEILEEMPEADGYFNSEGHGLCKVDVIPYPYLMRPLHWWEERRPEDLPQFVKDLSEKKVLKARYKFSEGVLVYVETMMEGTGWYVNALPDIEPATYADYAAYITALAKIDPFND